MTIRRDTATWVTYGALFAFGLLNALLGPALPYLRQELHLSYVEGALHQVAFAIGGMTAGIVATRTTAPRRRTIVVGLGGAGLAALVLGYADRLALTLAASLVISGLATAALIRMWALLADLHHRHRAVVMTEGEISVSLAGILMPIVVGVCAATAVGWSFATVISLVVVAGAVLAVARTAPPETQDLSEDSGTPVAPGSSRTGLTLTAIFAVVALEFTLSFWVATYLHDDVGLTRDTSVTLVSALYAANLVGRLLTSRITRRVPTAHVLWACLAVALAGMPLLLAADGPLLATAGMVVVGIGIGGTFPLASALHVEASHRSADQALGQTLTVAGIGQVVAPLAAGAIAEASSLRIGLLVLPVLVLLAAASTRFVR